MKNRIAPYLTAVEKEQYEDWADAVFELAFNYDDACTLEFGEDFCISQSKAQREKWVAALKDRRN